jgi:hypothetical protein
MVIERTRPGRAMTVTAARRRSMEMPRRGVSAAVGATRTVFAERPGSESTGILSRAGPGPFGTALARHPPERDAGAGSGGACFARAARKCGSRKVVVEMRRSSGLAHGCVAAGFLPVIHPRGRMDERSEHGRKTCVRVCLDEAAGTGPARPALGPHPYSLLRDSSPQGHEWPERGARSCDVCLEVNLRG